MSSFRRPLEITRRAPGQYVDGIWQEGAETTLTIMASVQPATPDDMMMLPEGRRERSAYVLFTATPLRTAVEGRHNADTLEIYGEAYEVTQVGVWQNNVLPHYRAIATKVEGDGD